MSREKFDRLFADGQAAILTGEHRVQAPPVEGGSRWGVSTLLRPDLAGAKALDEVAHEAATVAGGKQWVTGGAESSHLTVRTMGPWRDHVDDGVVQRYTAALTTAAAGIGTLTFTVTGLTVTTGSVMAYAQPADDSADRLAQAYEEALGPDGWYENDLDRDFWYLSLVHFAEPLAQPQALIDWVAERRELAITTVTVDEVQLAHWRFSGAGMKPEQLAAIPL